MTDNISMDIYRFYLKLNGHSKTISISCVFLIVIIVILITHTIIYIYCILIDSIIQMTYVLDCGLVFNYMLVNFDWPLL